MTNPYHYRLPLFFAGLAFFAIAAVIVGVWGQ